jgi:RimJ/RimL family protein N-acetyltransferase
MAWTLTADTGEFLDAAGDFLRADPARHTIQLSVTEMLRSRGGTGYGGLAPLFGWWRPAGEDVTCALVHTPPYPILLARLPEGSAEPLAAALAARGAALPGVNAEEPDAREFAAAWGARTGAAARVRRRSRLFRLGQLVPPSPSPPGAARVATDADRDLLVSWWDAFTAETDELNPAGAVDDRISYGGLTLWEDDGTPVAMAGATRPVAGMVRIGPVYTPPRHRRRGFGAAVTAAVSRAVLQAGASLLVLFTDLANPTSNALYPRLGFQPVADRLNLSFDA